MVVLARSLRPNGLYYSQDFENHLTAGDAAPLQAFAAAAMAATNVKRCLVPVPLDLPEEEEERLAAHLSESERQQAARFHRLRDRRHYVVAHGRIRELLAERLGIRPEAVLLGTNRYGKPGLQHPQADSGWHFNLSYSDGPGGALALCALSRWNRIGVALEWIRPLDHAESAARHFFSLREYEIYRSLAPEDRQLGFFQCWTRKEAFVKALGKGLSYNLAEFDVSLAPGNPARILRVGGLPGEWCGWHLESIGPIGGRVAAVVIQQKAN